MLSWTLVYAGDFYVVPTKKKSYAPVEKTGQAECYKSDGTAGTCTCGPSDCPVGQDGDLKKGVTWPSPRFTDNSNGTVTDNLTRLIWLKNAWCSCFYLSDSTGQNNRVWGEAVTACHLLSSAYCGLTDGSSAGDWRLPNVKELQSLIDYGRYNPALPAGNPFTGVESSYYWSGTTHAWTNGNAWIVGMYGGLVINDIKGSFYYVWPVRSDN